MDVWGRRFVTLVQTSVTKRYASQPVKFAQGKNGKVLTFKVPQLFTTLSYL